MKQKKKRLLNTIALTYALLCFVAILWVGCSIYYGKLLGECGGIIAGRESTVALFFKQPDGYWRHEKPWYSIATELRFKEQPLAIQLEEASGFVRFNLAPHPHKAAGNQYIDYRLVEGWLHEILRNAHYFGKDEPWLSLESIFGRPDKFQVEQIKLKLILSVIPLRAKLSILNKSLGHIGFFFTILMGVPVLIGQLIIWLRDLSKDRSLSPPIGLSPQTFSVIVLISGFYLFRLSDIWKGSVHLKFKLFTGGFVFAAVFLALWGLNVLIELVSNEVRCRANERR